MLTREDRKNLSKKILRIIPESPMRANAYLLDLHQDVFLIDPSFPPEWLEETPEGKNLLQRMKGIIATHCHYDHIKEADTWRNKYPKLKLMAHKDSALYLSNPVNNVSAQHELPVICRHAEEVFEDEARIPLEDDYSLRVIYTPGHAQDLCMFLLLKGKDPVLLFSGDHIFKRSIGRTDLPLSNPDDMERSLEKVLHLANKENWPQDLLLLAGHGDMSTWGEECEHNPFLLSLQQGEDLPEDDTDEYWLSRENR